ncbi:MAG: NAD-glutamate dehydrogenase, partial [Sphingomonadaceae bacterium]|nr:NAD-glutamate dehydrogenase [Sphingomonadaceae bacterium]
MSSKSALAKALARRLSAAQLPGDAPIGGKALDDAAAFVIAAAACRSGGQSAVAIESVSGAAGERFMRLALINDDMPFLVDSIASTVAAHGLAIDRLIHPVVAVRRDSAGQLTELVEGDAAGEKRESMVYIETSRADARQRSQL